MISELLPTWLQKDMNGSGYKIQEGKEKDHIKGDGWLS